MDELLGDIMTSTQRSLDIHILVSHADFISSLLFSLLSSMENHPGYRQFVALRQIKIKLNNRFVALFGTKTGTCLACRLEIECAAIL